MRGMGRTKRSTKGASFPVRRSHHRAMDAYLRRDWDAAQALWEDLAAEDADCALYGLYIERVQWLREDDPGPGWDGTFRHTAK